VNIQDMETCICEIQSSSSVFYIWHHGWSVRRKWQVCHEPFEKAVCKQLRKCIFSPLSIFSTLANMRAKGTTAAQMTQVPQTISRNNKYYNELVNLHNLLHFKSQRNGYACTTLLQAQGWGWALAGHRHWPAILRGLCSLMWVLQ
jgi:hypothetical protein